MKIPASVNYDVGEYSHTYEAIAVNHQTTMHEDMIIDHIPSRMFIPSTQTLNTDKLALTIMDITKRTKAIRLKDETHYSIPVNAVLWILGAV